MGEGPIHDINCSVSAVEERFNIKFSKTKTKFCSSVHCNSDNGYLFANGNKISKFKANNKNVNFPT